MHRLTAELGGAQVATVGRVDLLPNLVNVVPARATFTVDLRNTDDAVLCTAEQRLADVLAEVAERHHLEVRTTSLARFEPVDFDPEMVGLVERVARELGHSTTRLPSGAGHDAQMLARVCPTAMIFVPSIDGLSHNLAEDTAPDDLQAGADVLLRVVLELAEVA
jgi:N-carbamoyl-L-amino-acid hydrolase